MAEKRVFHSLNQWVDIIQQCRTSGLSDIAWCEQNGISVSTFYNAVKRCQKSACEIPQLSTNKQCKVQQQVVAVDFGGILDAPSIIHEPTTINNGTTNHPTIQLVVNDYKLQIYDHVDRETLRTTLLVLKELC